MTILIIGLLTMVWPWAVWAQSGPYQDSGSVAFGNASNPCTGPLLQRTISVADSFVIGDVDVGLLIAHTWRDDIQATLRSPSNTTATLLTADGTIGFQNYNIRLDDEATTDVNTGSHASNDSLLDPPYTNAVRPSGSLSVFDGENAQGTWTLEFCDIVSFDDGTYQQAELFFASATDADISVSIATSNASPDEGTNVILTYTVTNSGPLTATGLTAQITLPAGLSYLSDDGTGAFNATTGIWTIPASLTGGNSTSLQITAYVDTSGGYTTEIELLTSDQSDPDSTPGNGSTAEDDDASLTLVPVTPAIPVLSCPGAPSVVDWDSEIWNDGDLTNTYTVDTIDVTLTVSDPGSGLINNPLSGETSPHEGTLFTGGLVPAESVVQIFANQAAQSSTINTSLSFGAAGQGVSKAQFTIFDVDFGSAQFEDQLVVNGTLNGTGVTPTITTSSANTSSIAGTTATITGTGVSNSDQSAGNVTIQFNAPVDSVTFTYGNGTNAPSNPGQQGIAIHDLKFCEPTFAELSATKSVSVWDPAAAGLYALPGNDVVYTISATNTGNGSADTDSIVLIDPMPTHVEFYNGDIDDGGPETNPVSFAQTGAGLTFNYASDVAFSNAVSNPTDFASCTYVPTVGYDPNVTYICINPSGGMAAGDPDPTFSVSFRARIK